MRSEFSESSAAVGAEDVVEKDLIDVVASEDFEVVRDNKGLIWKVGFSRFFAFSFKRVGVEENKRARRPAQLGNLGEKQTEMVGVVKRSLFKYSMSSNLNRVTTENA